MRSSFLLALPALVAAEQKPLGDFGDKLQGWWKQAQSYIPTQVPSVPNPVHAAAAKIANLAVTPLTINNFKEVLESKLPPKATGEPDEWLVYIDGGNKTCYGRCENTTLAWNAATVLVSAQSGAPKLASIDCETDGVLCAAWSVTPPSLYHFLIPREADADATVRYLPLNTTDVTAKSIADFTTKKQWEAIKPYTGLFHPFNSPLAKFGINIPLGWVIWGFAQMPSWLPMILISFISRSFM
jgi:hypothetical protein